MARVELNFDETVFIFETVMRIRSTEMGIGQQLRAESMIELFSEARARFLYAKNLREIDSNYFGILITDVCTQYLSRVHAREELLFEVGLADMNPYGGDFVIRASRMYDGSVVALGKFGFVYYNYLTGSVAELDKQLKQLFSNHEGEDLIV